MMLKKVFKAAAVSAAAVMLLAGCRDKPAESAPQQTAAVQPAKEKVTVALWGPELLANYSQFLCEAFPEVDFEFVLATNSTDYYRWRAEKGDLPDILTVRRFSLKDALALKERLIDLGNTGVAAAFRSSFLDSYTYSDGTVNWLPASAEVDSIIVNKTLFAEHGIPLPTDWRSFVEADRAFEKKGIRGFVSDFLSDFTCLETLQGFAVSNMTSMEGREWRRRYESGTENRLSETVWMPAFDRFFRVRNEIGLFGSDTELRNLDVKRLYSEGKAAMYRGTGSDLVKFPGRAGDESVILPYFTGTNEAGSYLTYPAFQLAVSKQAVGNPAREALVLRILEAMLSQEGQSRIAHGKNMVSYSRDVKVSRQSGLEELESAIRENRFYIRLASNDMFRVSKNVVQRILKDELRTPQEAFAAFNEELAKNPCSGKKRKVMVEQGWSSEFELPYGNRAASAIFNTVRAEAGTDLLLAQANYAGAVYPGEYTKREIRYLTKNDYCWPIIAKLTGQQLFDVIHELLTERGFFGNMSNRSTLYVSSGFEMEIEEKDGAFHLLSLTVGGRPMDPAASYSVYVLGDVDMLLPKALKKAGVGDYEIVRTHTNDYLEKRLLEKQGRLEQPTGYIRLRD
ncbi:MAG: hypothetical protein ACI4SY_01060 [Sutterella sp.]